MFKWSNSRLNLDLVKFQSKTRSSQIGELLITDEPDQDDKSKSSSEGEEPKKDFLKQNEEQMMFGGASGMGYIGQSFAKEAEITEETPD